MSQDDFTWIAEVRLTEYNPDWPEMFVTESEVLHELLGENAVGIHHVGSTAIPCMVAKPVVDLLVEVSDLEVVQFMTEEFKSAGYEVLGESGIPGRHFITRNSDGERTYDVHIFQSSHKEIGQMILFRDRMRENPSEAEAYSGLKQELANKYRHDPVRYTQEKSEFILGAIEAQKSEVSRREE